MPNPLLFSMTQSRAHVAAGRTRRGELPAYDPERDYFHVFRCDDCGDDYLLDAAGIPWAHRGCSTCRAARAEWIVEALRRVAA